MEKIGGLTIGILVLLLYISLIGIVFSIIAAIIPWVIGLIGIALVIKMVTRQ